MRVDTSSPVVTPRGRFVAPLALALLPFALFAPATFMWGVFVGQDIQAYFYPYHVLPARLLADGHLPLWNPYVFSGIPLFGDGQTAMLYPPNWLFFVLPGETAFNLVALLQFSIAGVGCYYWARALGQWVVPAFVAALAFMFCGFLSARIVHLSIMSGAALLPWILLCLDRLLAAEGRQAARWTVALSVALALQAVAGHPQVPVYTALAAGLYALVRVVERRPARAIARQTGTAIARVGAAYALGYALAAVQLVPWSELARLSIRAAGTPYAFVFGTSSTGADWLLFLFPFALGAHAESPFASGTFDIAHAVRAWEHSAYVGMLPLALVLVAVGHFGALTRRSPALPERAPAEAAATLRRRWYSLLFLLLLLGLGVLIAAGWHTPFSHVVYATPVLGSLRAVERALVLAAFALATLAGFGLQRILEAPAPRRGLLAPALVIAAVPALIVLHANLRPGHPLLGIPGDELAALSIGLPRTYVPLLFAGAAAILLAWCSRVRAGRVVQGLVVALVLVDLGLYATSFTPVASRRLYRAQPQVLETLREDEALARKATVLISRNDLDQRLAQQSLAMSWGMVYGVEDVNGFNSLQPRRYTDYVFGTHVDDVSYGYLGDERLFRPDDPVLASLNVRYVLVPSTETIALGPHLRQVLDTGRVRVYEHERAYPRAYFTEAVRTASDPRSVLRHVTAPGFDARREALVEGDVPRLLPVTGPAQAEASRPGPNELVVTTSSAETRFLVVSEMYFPGWRAYVDGVETPIYRTNYLFRGVVVPGGDRTVRFVYRPGSVVGGAAISLLALVLIGALTVRGGRVGAAGDPAA
jgi:hypothetical protein